MKKYFSIALIFSMILSVATCSVVATRIKNKRQAYVPAASVFTTETSYTTIPSCEIAVSETYTEIITVNENISLTTVAHTNIPVVAKTNKHTEATKVITTTISTTETTLPETTKAIPEYENHLKSIEVFNSVNETRIKNGVAPLELDETLCALAYVRAQEQSQRGGHTRPDGRKYNTVLSDYGYWHRNNGENIVITRGFSGDFSVECWLNSESHKKNMLKDFWTHTGVGVYVEGNRYFVVQLFIHKF